MEESFEQKVIRNVQGNFAVYKATEVVGAKSIMPNVEWEEREEVDKFFMFAKNLGAKVIYIAEGEETDEQTGATNDTILQVGFLFQGVMHHINYADDDEDYEEEDDEEYFEQDGESEDYDQEDDDEYDESESDDEDVGNDSQEAEEDELVKEVQSAHEQPQERGPSQSQQNLQQDPMQRGFNQNSFRRDGPM